MLLLVFIANKIFIINKVDSFKDYNKLIKKFVKSKIEKLSKSRNLKGKIVISQPRNLIT